MFFAVKFSKLIDSVLTLTYFAFEDTTACPLPIENDSFD